MPTERTGLLARINFGKGKKVKKPKPGQLPRTPSDLEEGSANSSSPPVRSSSSNSRATFRWPEEFHAPAVASSSHHVNEAPPRLMPSPSLTKQQMVRALMTSAPRSRQSSSGGGDGGKYGCAPPPPYSPPPDPFADPVVVCPDPFADPPVAAIVSPARTGRGVQRNGAALFGDTTVYMAPVPPPLPPRRPVVPPLPSASRPRRSSVFRESDDDDDDDSVGGSAGRPGTTPAAAATLLPCRPETPAPYCTEEYDDDEQHGALGSGYGTISPSQQERARLINSEISAITGVAHNAMGGMLDRGEAVLDIRRRGDELGGSTVVFRRQMEDHTAARRQQIERRQYHLGIAVCTLVFVLICFIKWLARQAF
ncbi:hypothetical protein BC828DRAFT_377938 [Blastocladiella britannica]|nr:hypothetical protein BC828DRAFT_377938 [Blastocladiella britannica]